MKKTAVAAMIVAGIFAALAFLLPLLVSSEALRTAVAHQLSEASGAEIALSGPIHFSIFPDFGVVVEDFAYTSGDGAVAVTAARSVASVQPLALLSGQVHVTGIELQSPRIALGEAAAAADEQSEGVANADEDIFKVVAGYLERLSVDRIAVSDGEVVQLQDGTPQALASDIEIHLTAPGIAEPISLAFSGVVNGERMELDADIGSLRDLLARQPARISLTTKIAAPPHPLLAELRATGSIQLAPDGSYAIAGGEIASNGQKMLLDASYMPGERAFVLARVKAEALTFTDALAADAAPTATETAPDGAQDVALDLSVLRGIDADIELYAEALQAGSAIAREVTIAAQLQDGRLISTLRSGDIAQGALAASIVMDVNADIPGASGALDVSGIDIESLMALAGQRVPVAGRLSSQLQYAFQGAGVAAIRDSLNLRGDIALSGGRIAVAALENIIGQGAGVVDAVDAAVRIENVLQPLALSGTARWNGEAVGYSAALVLSDLFWGQKGNVTADFTSAPVNASFSGTVSPDGSISGATRMSAPSLSHALNWVGQDAGRSLGKFDFSGEIAASSSGLTLSGANIGLDDMRAQGSVSVVTSGKPRITAALSVDALDFARLTGGGQSTVAASASTAPAAIDLSVLRAFDADISLNANQLGYGNIKAGPVSATLSVADGVARLATPQAGFYDGTLAINVVANGVGDVPAIDLAAAMDGVQALPFLTAAAGFQQIEGKLSASLQLAGAGPDSQAFARSLNGPVKVMFSDGALRGIDVAGLVRNVQSLIGGGYSADSEAKTEFSELSADVVVQNGVGQAQDIRLLGPFVRMSGQGSVDLAAQTIDMRLDPRVVMSADGQGGDFDVSGLGMPVMVVGALSAPRVYPDLSALLADPASVLQAFTQMGGGIGDLAGSATGAIGGLGDLLPAAPGGVTGDAASDMLGQLINQAQGGAGAAPTGQQELITGVVGGVLGSALGMPNVQPPMPPIPQDNAAPAASASVPLPRPDPRGPAPATEPQVSAPSGGGLVDVIVPQLAPEADAGTVDSIKGLINQFGL